MLMNRRWMKAAQIGLAWLWMAALVGSVSGAQRDQAVLRLGYFPNLTHAQALYARATGEFEKQTGVQIKWTAFNAGPTAIESLFTDAIDATFLGPSPTITAHCPARSRGERSPNRGSHACRRCASASSGNLRFNAISAPNVL